MNAKNLFSLLVLVALLLGVLPTAAAVEPPEPEREPPASAGTTPASTGIAPATPAVPPKPPRPEGGGIESLSGSFVAFDPSVGGDACYISGATQTFCFEAHSFTNDYEYVLNLWQRFPADWTVLGVYVQGTPVCTSGASWGAFSWSFQTPPYEVNIAHTRYQQPIDDCVAYYCFEVVSGSGAPDALESWYWAGDGWGGPPHWPCSSNQYTPAGQNACDEYVNPQAAIPPCQAGLYLSPDQLDVEGCAAVPQTHTFNLSNLTGADGTFNLAYAVLSGNATLTGPAQIALLAGASQDFDVMLTPDECLPEGTQVVATVDASGNGYTDQSVIIKTILGELGGWETVPASAPGWAGTGYPVDGCAAMNADGHWVTYLIGDQASYAGFWGYDHNDNVWFQPAAIPPADRWAPDWAYDEATNLCYMTGGANTPGGGTYNEAWQYDPVADTWTPLPSFTSIRDFHDSWVGRLNGTRYLCIGGGVNASSVLVQSTQCYDLATGAWHAENVDMAPYPTDPFGAADGTLHAATGDQFWYVGGAINAGATITDQAWYWDDADDAWHSAGNTGFPRYRVEGDFKHGDFYQVAGSSGGFNPTPTVVRGQYQGGTWVWSQVQDLSNSRMDNVAVMIPPYTLLAGRQPAAVPETIYDPEAVADLPVSAAPPGHAPAGTAGTWSSPQGVVLWDNGAFDGINGLASELGTLVTDARTADDFQITDPAGWQIDTIRTQMLQNSNPWNAILEIYADSGGAGPGALLATFPMTSWQLLGSAFGFPWYEYTFDTPGLQLPPGTYWVSSIGLGDGTLADRAFFGTAGSGVVQLQEGYFLSNYFGIPTWIPASAAYGYYSDYAFRVEGSIGGGVAATLWSVDGYGSTSPDYVEWLIQCPVCEAWGWLDGYVMDSETGDVFPACTDAVVHIEPGNLDVGVDPLTGYFGPVELMPGTYTVEATAPGYSLETAVVDVVELMTTTVSFNLWRPVVDVEPANLISVTAYISVETTYPLTISNLGHLPLDFEIVEVPDYLPVIADDATYQPEPAAVGIDLQIYTEMAAAPDGKTDFFVAFEETADLSPAFHMPWAERGRFVVDALQEVADASQAGVTAWLDRQGIEYTSFWINNTLFVHAGEATLNALAAFPEVSGFKANDVSQIMPVEEAAAPLAETILAPAYPWNTGSSDAGSPMADMVHGVYGLRGEGIVIGGMDTGVLYNHVGLVQNYRGCLDPPACTTFDHTYSWADPANHYGGTPGDDHGHGTATHGIMAGDDDPGLPTGAWIGMAPNAQWIHCVGCPGGSCPSSATTACAQWFLAPGGDSNMRPQVVNHSWGNWVPDDCNGNAFQAELMAYRAADILPAFAAGNVGDYVVPPHCYTSTSPANNTDPGGVPIAFASGAHGTAGTLDYYSSGGPNACNYGYLFPDVTSPGLGSCTTNNGGGYDCGFGGTSSASPHTAGCAALVRQAAPTLSIGPDTLNSPIEQALREGATDVADGCGNPDESPDWNNKYGEGNLNCYEAVELVFQQDIPWVWVDPITGTVPVEDEVVVDVTVHCTQTQDYTGTLRILHNDPCRAAVEVPIILHCLAQMPELYLAKEATPPVQYPGEPVTYTVTFGNAGPGDAMGVVISDTLPAGVVYVSSNPPGIYDPVAHDVSWMVDLPAGSAITATIVVTVDEAALSGTWLTNTAYLFWTDTVLMAEAATLVQVGPIVRVEPPALESTQCPDCQVTYTLSICNDGDQPLDYTIAEVPATGLAAPSTRFSPQAFTPAAVQVAPGGLTSSRDGTGTSAPPNNIDAVLWDQPTDYTSAGFAAWLPSAGWGAFSADDFQNSVPWHIDTIYVPGWAVTGSVLDAVALHWCIYPDAGGVPAGQPLAGGEYWCWSAAPTHPAVTIGGPLGGDVTLDVVAGLGAPLDLPPGVWWLVFYPELASPVADYYWAFGTTANGYTSQFIDPADHFGAGLTSWTSWLTIGGFYDMAFRLEGTSDEIPWLSENPASGTVPAGTCAAVDVVFDSTGMAPGTYTGALQVLSNDRNTPEVTIPVTMTVLEPAAIAGVTVVITDLQVTFDATVSGTEPISYAWDFGDGNTSDVEDPVHVYDAGGCYTVTLTVENGCGTDVWTEQICVCDPATIVDVTYAISDLQVTFDATASGTPPIYYAWDFGDGNTSDLEDPVHVYDAGGCYTVTLTVENGCGTDIWTEQICVCDPVSIVDVTYAISDLQVTFDATASGTPPIYYAWDFGDGNTSNLEDPVHVYDAGGCYTVTLTVENGCGTDVWTEQICVCDPVSIVDVTYATSDLQVTFDATVSGTEPISYTWDFGDGNTSDVEDPVHVYAEGGCYTVTLTVENGCGTDVWTEQICVCDPATIVDVTYVLNDLEVTFDATISGTVPVSYTWDFGDGATSTEEDPIHVYDAGGCYTVTLTAYNDCGEDVWTEQICVCDPVFIAQVEYLVDGLQVTFDATVSGTEPITFAWDLGDDTFSDLEDPVHVYDAGGCYTVTLTAHNDCGEDVWTEQICVCDPVSGLDFGWTPDFPVAGDEVLFTATAQGTEPIAFDWDFGDDTLGAGITATHAYTQAGDYLVTVMATNCDGDYVVMTHTITIAAACVPVSNLDFTWLPALPMAGVEVSFAATADGTLPITFDWDFGDGNTATGQNPTHTFTAAGDYLVELTATNCDGISATQSYTVTAEAARRYYYLPIIAKD